MRLLNDLERTYSPAVFAFCNRRRDRVKLLFFDRSGFVLVLKRLTEDKFRWPAERYRSLLTTEHLYWILDGIDIDAMIRHPVRQYQIWLRIRSLSLNCTSVSIIEGAEVCAPIPTLTGSRNRTP
ncbi:MAG: Transposase-like protein [Rhizobium sp.]|nr:Transposase-like protein [Rhizobium sp.]